MSFIKFAYYSLIILIFISCDAKSYDLLIQNVSVIDLENKTVQKHNILIDDGIIIRVGVDSVFKDISAKKIIEGSGRYVIPGLWDSHVHLMEEVNYKNKLADFITYGITSVRDTGGNLDSLKIWNEQIKIRELRGPTIYFAGPTLSGKKEGEAAFTITIEDTLKVQSIIDSLSTAGVHFIKIHDQVKPKVLEEILRQAKLQNLPVAGHVPFGTSMEDASEMGMASFEHLSAMIASLFNKPVDPVKNFGLAYAYMVGESGEELYKTLSINSTFVTPTLITYKRITDAEEDEGVRNMGRRALKKQQKIVKAMVDNDVTILAGTDFGIPELLTDAGQSLIDELRLLSQSGIDNYEVIKSATLNPARFFKIEDYVGLIKEGYKADLVLLKKNPIEDIDNLLTLNYVIKGGEVV
ncbi:amidohydrolase family protein [Marivirga sp.]|uniref:amidohydrolase family protein n=1 Tax=Marivirga sp. TaxID=2018662 RepID=UPI0025E4637C|nr:amidohydrolase family protein [Marivirga sp.]